MNTADLLRPVRSAHFPFARTDLLLALKLIAALDDGRMPMHAADYLSLSTLALLELRELDDIQLRALFDGIPASEHELPDQVRQERGLLPWAATIPACAGASFR